MTDPPDGTGIPGPWQHRHIAANGARFHVVEAGPPRGRLVVLLHGFPELWWAWRHQLPALAAAGHHVVAMDLRGYGGSDKTPGGYDPVTLAQDVTGVVKALGARRGAVVGHGWGGYVGWAAATIHHREVAALCVLSAPHPLSIPAALRNGEGWPALRHLLEAQVPMWPERRLARPATGFLAAHLRSWSGPGGRFPDAETVETYQRAISVWPSSHCALGYHRWLFRSRLRADGRRFAALMRPPVTVPVCTVVGDRDPALPPSAMARSRDHVAGDLVEHVLPGVGHFPHEEDPEAVTDLLRVWLAALPPPG